MSLSSVRFGAIAITQTFKSNPDGMQAAQKASRFTHLLGEAHTQLSARDSATMAAINQHNALVRPPHLSMADEVMKMAKKATGAQAPDKPDDIMIIHTTSNDVVVHCNNDKHFMDTLLFAFAHQLLPAIQQGHFTRQEVDDALNALLSSASGFPIKVFGNSTLLENHAQQAQAKS